jgi:DNA-binding CsgD family transcriptional regulator
MSDYRDRGARRRTVVDVVGHARLTSREWEVLDLLRQGWTTAAIARDLVLSQATVRTHVAAVLRKLGASDRDEAIRLFEGRCARRRNAAPYRVVEAGARFASPIVRVEQIEGRPDDRVDVDPEMLVEVADVTRLSEVVDTEARDRLAADR